jgi:hypothetical protein
VNRLSRHARTPSKRILLNLAGKFPHWNNAHCESTGCWHDSGNDVTLSSKSTGDAFEEDTNAPKFDREELSDQQFDGGLGGLPHLFGAPPPNGEETA